MSIFTWRRASVPTASDNFRASLPTGPLVEHLTGLHAMICVLTEPEPVGGKPSFDQINQIKLMAENSLREIAVFTQRTYPEPPVHKPIANPVRVVRIREGKDKK